MFIFKPKWTKGLYFLSGKEISHLEQIRKKYGWNDDDFRLQLAGTQWYSIKTLKNTYKYVISKEFAKHPEKEKWFQLLMNRKAFSLSEESTYTIGEARKISESANNLDEVIELALRREQELREGFNHPAYLVKNLEDMDKFFSN
jgi:hypothetical protein